MTDGPTPRQPARAADLSQRTVARAIEGRLREAPAAGAGVDSIHISNLRLRLPPGASGAEIAEAISREIRRALKGRR